MWLSMVICPYSTKLMPKRSSSSKHYNLVEGTLTQKTEQQSEEQTDTRYHKEINLRNLYRVMIEIAETLVNRKLEAELVDIQDERKKDES
jgi:hypothetical protein